jgi:hypothetical protein
MGGEGLVEWGEVAMAMPTLLALAHVYQMSWLLLVVYMEHAEDALKLAVYQKT